jgi:hypothetical protein
MANHVSNYLSVQSELSEAGQKVWDEFVVGKLIEDTNLSVFVDKPQDKVMRGDMCEVIGAKWAYAIDVDDTGVSMESAWSPVGLFAEMVAKKIGAVDPGVQLALTYEDEGLNFIGVTTYNRDGEDTVMDLDYDDIRQMVIHDDEDLQEWWDADEQEWIEEHEEEAEDRFNDIQWDIINDWQMRNMLWSTPDSI